MCGINGIYHSGNSSAEKRSIAEKMNFSLAHRGPDAGGVWSNDLIALGHRRLSIIDLDARSNQPMHSFDGRYTIVYNGEIYNFKEIKFELSRAPQGSQYGPYPFKTFSDTEVVLAAYIRYGKHCLELFNGMFSVAIWDDFKKELFIARDRLGVKPLYYYASGCTFIFSSEVRTLLKTGYINRRISADSLIDYLSYQTVHAPETIIEGISSLMPGHYLTFCNEELNIERWWNPTDYFETKTNYSDYNDVKKNIRELFFNSVEKRLVSDVPSGVFLSGGIDSSAVVGAMAQISLEKIDTFNVTFGTSTFSEDVFANQIAKKFNTDHHEISLSPEKFLSLLPEALHAMDHPSGDGPNTYVISKAVKDFGIKMALTGLGGDEIFCGYDLFKRLYSIEKKWWLNAVPRFARIAFAELYKIKNKSVKSQKLNELLTKPIINFEYAYPILRKTLNDHFVKGISRKETMPMNKVYRILRLNSINNKNKLLSKYSIAEMQTYLPNVLLRDADQMSMAVGLELRVPFLDYRLVEFVLSLEDEIKYPKTPKKLLCESLSDIIPFEISTRKKMGFTFPWEQWMKNELKIFCDHYIGVLSSRDEVNGKVINAIWHRFLSGDQEITWSRIWHLVVLGFWLKNNGIED